LGVIGTGTEQLNNVKCCCCDVKRCWCL